MGDIIQYLPVRRYDSTRQRYTLSRVVMGTAIATAGDPGSTAEAYTQCATHLETIFQGIHRSQIQVWREEMNTCTHKQKPFGHNPFGKNYEPVEMEIRNFRLWQCPDCGLWFSLIGVTREYKIDPKDYLGIKHNTDISRHPPQDGWVSMVPRLS